MTTRTTWRWLLVVAVIALAPAVQGRERLEIRARPTFSFAPAEVHLEFTILPDAANRALEVTAESFDFYRGSLVELDGERAQHVVSIRYRDLPAGEYNVRGALLDGEGHERAVVDRQITVMSTGGER